MKKLIIYLFAVFLFCPQFVFADRFIELRYGYDFFQFDTKQKEIFDEYEKYFYKGIEVFLTEEEKEKTEHLLEIRKEQGINRAFLEKFLEEKVVPVLQKERQDAKISYNSEKNKVEFEGVLSEGIRVDIRKTALLLKKALEEKVFQIEIITQKESPVFTYAEDWPFHKNFQVIASGVSDFSGSTQNRITNILVSLEKFQGQVVLPQEVFSFLKTLGEVSAQEGYQKELVIKGENLVPEYGGGVCQVSSTLYRVVFLAGLPITERKNHSFNVSYYSPAGADATVYSGVQDLKFLNPFDTPLFLSGKREGNRLYMYIFGEPLKEEVKMFGPFISHYRSAPETRYLPSTTLAPGEKFLISPAINGFMTTWYRVIGEKTETFTSVYQARPQTYKVGGL
jgi:vancomycin resistance protein YoaR